LENGFGEASSEARRAESGGGVLGEGAAPPAMVCVSTASSPSEVRRGAPAAKGFSRILNRAYLR